MSEFEVDSQVPLEQEVEHEQASAEVSKNDPALAASSAFTPKEGTDPERSLTLLIGDTEQVGAVLDRLHPNRGDVQDVDFHRALAAVRMMDTNHEAYDVREGTPSYPIVAPSGARTAISRRKAELRPGEVTGDEAMLAITTVFGRPNRYQVPMVNSGFRIEFEAPTADDWCWLEESLVENMGDVGRYTLGASYSNTKAFLRREIINFFLRHVRAHNIKDVAARNVEELRNLIADDDYETILGALLVAAKVNGYDVVVPCVDPECKGVTAGTISPAKLMRVDHSMMTEQQLEVICRGMRTLTTEKELKEYREAFTGKTAKYTWVSESDAGKVEMAIFFRKGSLQDHLVTSTAWANGINTALNRHMGQADDDAKRQRITKHLLRVNQLTEFLPYIDRLELRVLSDVEGEEPSEPTIIKDAGVISRVLKERYQDEGIAETLKAINEYVVTTNPVVFGVPKHPCPTCGKMAEQTIVPVNVEAQFFILGLSTQIAVRYTVIGL